MFRRFDLAVGFSFALCCVAVAQPQTVTYFTGHCPTQTGTCDIVASLPSQGFVLTDVIAATPVEFILSLSEVSGVNEVERARFRLGDIGGSGNHVQSYHLISGVHFAGGTGIRALVNGADGLDNSTLIGYIPNTGCCPGAAPAIGSSGMIVVVIAMLVIGGALMRKRIPAP